MGPGVPAFSAGHAPPAAGLIAAFFAGASLVLLVTPGPLSGDSSEAGFARDMMVHHAQAVEMAEIVRDKTESDDIRTLATDIALTQQAQIGIMQDWLDVWGLPASGTELAMSWMGHSTEGPMPGMATPRGDRPPEGSPACRGRRAVMVADHQLPPGHHTDGRGHPQAPRSPGV